MAWFLAVAAAKVIAKEVIKSAVANVASNVVSNSNGSSSTGTSGTGSTGSTGSLKTDTGFYKHLTVPKAEKGHSISVTGTGTKDGLL